MTVKFDGAMKPTALDNVIARISPGWGARRLRDRARYSALAGFGYESARGGKTSMFGWAPGQGSADRDTLPDLPTLRAQSPDLKRNNPLTKGAINTVVTGAVGTGRTLQSRVDRAANSSSFEMNHAQRKRVEDGLEDGTAAAVVPISAGRRSSAATTIDRRRADEDR